MKRSKNFKVSWSSGPKLCQVKMFRTEDCPAKVVSQFQRHNHPKQSDLPPGFEGYHYVDKLNVSNIPRVKWKRPLKFIVNDTLMVGSGGESTESQTENLRIAKVMEATYPHRSAIPSRPSVSPVVEAECFDDSATPTIRLTPIEESKEELSHSMLESGFTANKQSQLETKPSCTTQEPVSGLAPDLSLAASTALTALMKTKEGSMVDPDRLVRFLNDPKMIKNLIKGITENQPIDINNNINPTRLVPQHVTTSPMVRKPQSIKIPQEQSFLTFKPFTSPEQRKRVSPPKPPLNQINGNRFNIPIAEQPSWLPPNHNHQRPQPQLHPNSAFRTSEMNNSQVSIAYGSGSQTGFNTYPMNLNRVDATVRPRSGPMKNIDYFKNLIKEHGTDNHETNQYDSQTGRVDNIKVQKQCIYFGTRRGCNLGDSCIYVHDRFIPNFEVESPNTKRVKLERYENYGL